MRGIAIVAVCLMLLSGILGYCPACASAQEQQAPVDAHACCTKQMAHADGAASMPMSESPSPDSDESEDCGRFNAVQIVAGVHAELGVDSAPMALPADAGLDALLLPASRADAFVTPAVDTSPPLSFSLPIRI